MVTDSAHSDSYRILFKMTIPSISRRGQAEVISEAYINDDTLLSSTLSLDYVTNPVISFISNVIVVMDAIAMIKKLSLKEKSKCSKAECRW